MTVNVGVYPIESLKDLTDQDRESFGEGHAWHPRLAALGV